MNVSVKGAAAYTPLTLVFLRTNVLRSVFTRKDVLSIYLLRVIYDALPCDGNERCDADTGKKARSMIDGADTAIVRDRGYRRGVPFVPDGKPNSATARAADSGELGSALLAAFRRHPHINNVMTHISQGQWDKVGEALRAILDRAATADALSPLAVNIVELLVAEEGVTGRILKPYMKELLGRLLPARDAARVEAHISGIFESATARSRAAEVWRIVDARRL